MRKTIAKTEKFDSQIYFYLMILPILIGLTIILATNLYATDERKELITNPQQQGWQQQHLHLDE